MLGIRKYVGISALAAAGVVYHAFSTREQFFPSVYYLSTSKVAIAVLGNFAFAVALCTYFLMTKIFLGALREAEVERVNQRISQAIIETCLAMTIFRDEFNVKFVALFTILSFIKVFHWLVQDRVDYIETTPHVSRLHHLRIVTFMGILLAIDSAFLKYLVGKTLEKSASVHLLFSFEYVILASAIISTFLKYTLSMVDAWLEGRWEHKGVYVFYLELLTDMLHLFVYLVFFVIVFTNFGLPVHLLRDLYWTFRNFRNRVIDFLRYRRVTANMDERFSNATEEDLARCDGICIICREEMVATGRNKKLPCSHVFHTHCLRSWLERQQNCPTCRASVFAPPPAAQAPAAQAEGAAPAAGGAVDQEELPEAVRLLAAEVAANGPAMQMWREWRRRQPNPPAADGEAAPAAAPEGDGAEGEAVAGPSVAAPAASMPSRAASGSQGEAAGAQAAGAGIHGAPLQQQAYPVAYPYMWNVPQWAPTTSMALFMPGLHAAPLQYAGQQRPDVPTSMGSQGYSLPILPMVLPPAIQALMHSPPAGTPEQQVHQAAAAAAAAAAVMSSPYSTYSTMMLPPSIIPLGPGSAGSAPMSQEATAAAAANAAAAAAAAVLQRGNAQPSAETMEQVLRQQMEMVQNQMQRLQAHREQEGLSASRAPSAAQPSAARAQSSAPPQAQAPGPSAASSAHMPSSSAAQPAAQAAQEGTGAARSRPPHEPAPAAAEGSNPAEEIRQRRLNHFHTREQD
ncbi:g11511 [Coccomyxa viridis]|uniref:RING-type E3 ubiquitin transferase n=1 Tax=Coccomyxa viridis TaxID=1274662 RepID=A0ABP1GF53_9CHLO